MVAAAFPMLAAAQTANEMADYLDQVSAALRELGPGTLSPSNNRAMQDQVNEIIRIAQEKIDGGERPPDFGQPPSTDPNCEDSSIPNFCGLNVGRPYSGN
jgi:hypothetical protein